MPGGGPGGEGGKDPGGARPGLPLVRAAGLAGGAGQRGVLGLVVQVGEPGLRQSLHGGGGGDLSLAMRS